MSLVEREVTTVLNVRGQTLMSDELAAVLRQRVATKYYDQPQVVEAIARAILARNDIFHRCLRSY